MNKALLIAQKDIGEAVRQRSTYVSLLFLFAVIFPYFGGLRGVILNVQSSGSPETTSLTVRAYLNTLVSAMPLTVAVLVAGPFGAYAIILEKTRRTLESLLSTPVSLRAVWLGKSLSVFLPCMAMSLVVSASVLIVLEEFIVVPATGAFVIPEILPILTGTVIVPALVFLIVSLITLLQLVMENPRIPIIIFTGIFMAIYFATITNYVAWLGLSTIYLIAIAVLLTVSFVSQRFLTKERVVLSSKG
jgi:ABC-2 type transport system permease protein